MTRRHSKRAIGVEVLSGIVAFAGLLAALQWATHYDIGPTELPIALIAAAVVGFCTAITAYLRPDKRRFSQFAVPSASHVNGSAAASSTASVAENALDELWKVTEAAWSSGDHVRSGRKPTEWSGQLLQALEWKRFEELCTAYFEAAGGFTVRPTGLGADGGVDIYLYSPIALGGAPTGVVQCKAWKTDKVGVKQVRELYGIMAAEKARIGIFLATGEYTAEARAFAANKHLQLLSGEDLLGKLRHMPVTTSQRLLEQITAGDYTTPTCPNCGVKMTLRASRKADHIGQSFWGCVNYPRCRQTFTLPKQQ